MAKLNVNKILSNYTEEERKSLIDTMKLHLLFGINDAPETEEGFKNWCDKQIQTKYEKEAEEKAKKERAEKRELEKATSLCLTLEEYKDFKKIRGKITKHKRVIEALKEELKEEEEKLVYWEKRMKKYNKGI